MAMKVRPMLDYVKDGLDKVHNHPWSKPLGIALKVTGEICSLAGEAGVPVIGLLGAGLKLGGDLLSEGGNECASMSSVKEKLQESFANISDSFLVLQEEVKEVKDIAYKTFELTAALRYREGIEKVDAAYDTLVAGGHDLSQTLRRFDGYIIELETTQRQCLNADKVGEYLGILKNKKNATEACSAFFCYAVAIRAKYLQLVLLYYSYNRDQKRVQQEIHGFNYDVWRMAKKFHDHAGIKRMTPYLAPFIQKVLALRTDDPTLPTPGALPGGAGGWMVPSTNPKSYDSVPATKPTVHPSVPVWEEKPRKESGVKMPPGNKTDPFSSSFDSRKKSSASNLLRDIEHDASVRGISSGIRKESAGRNVFGNLDSSTRNKIDRALGDFGGIDGLLGVGGMSAGTRSGIGGSGSSSVSTSTKVVNGRKQSTRVEVKDGVETKEVTEDGRLVSKTVNGRNVPF